jgi:secondary thiamine-phosphate synthase enzyme
MEEIRVRTHERSALVDITERVAEAVRRTGVRQGAVVVQSLHTTAALTVNENADPDVAHDVVRKMGELAPHTEPYYRHAEGNSDSHVKTSLFGPSLTLIVHDGRPLLGRWQGIYLCEWDGPRERTVAVQVIAAQGSGPGGGNQII